VFNTYLQDLQIRAVLFVTT